MKPISSPYKTLKELHADLAQIDEEMREAGVPMHQREMRGWHKLSKKHSLGLRMPPPVANPAPDDLSWGALSAHIFAWFVNRYGTRQRIVYAPSEGLIDMNGDLFRMAVPIAYGQVDFEINPARLSFKYRRLIKNRVPKDNLLAKLEGLTQAYADSIPTTLYEAISEQAFHILRTCSEMLALHSTVLVAEAAVDIDAGVTALLDGISHGHARWCFHQAAEKSIKALLEHHGVQRATYFKASHDLVKLVALSPLLSQRVTAAQIHAITCSPKARYGEIPTSAAEALLAYQQALIVIFEALRTIPGKRNLTGFLIYPGPFPPSHFDPAIDGMDGEQESGAAQKSRSFVERLRAFLRSFFRSKK